MDLKRALHLWYSSRYLQYYVTAPQWWLSEPQLPWQTLRSGLETWTLVKFKICDFLRPFIPQSRDYDYVCETDPCKCRCRYPQNRWSLFSAHPSQILTPDGCSMMIEGIIMALIMMMTNNNLWMSSAFLPRMKHYVSASPSYLTPGIKRTLECDQGSIWNLNSVQLKVHHHHHHQWWPDHHHHLLLTCHTASPDIWL